jgi:hypothetical protein
MGVAAISESCPVNATEPGEGSRRGYWWLGSWVEDLSRCKCKKKGKLHKVASRAWNAEDRENPKSTVYRL